jgi:hypothetical protein
MARSISIAAAVLLGVAGLAGALAACGWPKEPAPEGRALGMSDASLLVPLPIC